MVATLFIRWYLKLIARSHKSVHVQEKTKAQQYLLIPSNGSKRDRESLLWYTFFFIRTSKFMSKINEPRLSLIFLEIEPQFSLKCL